MAHTLEASASVPVSEGIEGLNLRRATWLEDRLVSGSCTGAPNLVLIHVEGWDLLK